MKVAYQPFYTAGKKEVSPLPSHDLPSLAPSTPSLSAVALGLMDFLLLSGL